LRIETSREAFANIEKAAHDDTNRGARTGVEEVEWDKSATRLILRPVNPSCIPMADRIHSYADLRQFIHVALRIQHPEWVESDGSSPICDSYDVRFAELLGLNASREDVSTNMNVNEAFIEVANIA